eukprot:1982096-Amphidinium_carterae.1
MLIRLRKSPLAAAGACLCDKVERPSSSSSTNLIEDTCTELKSLYSTSVMNKLFIPISQVKQHP